MTGLLRPLAATLLATAALATSPALAETDYPWCSVVATGQDGMPFCRFVSLEQCRNYLSGKPGFCQPNARVVVREQKAKRGER